MGRVRPASATSEAIEAEVLLKVWDVLHPRAVGEVGVGERSERSELTVGGLAVAAEASGLRVHEYIDVFLGIDVFNQYCQMQRMYL